MENKKQELFSLVGFLRSAMEAQHLIPIRLAELSGVPSSVLSRVFSDNKGAGPRELSAINLYKVMKALKVIGNPPVYPYTEKQAHDDLEFIFTKGENDVKNLWKMNINTAKERISELKKLTDRLENLERNVASHEELLKEILRRLPLSATRKTGSGA